jgi:flagellar motor switch protein FliN/FliY
MSEISQEQANGLIQQFAEATSFVLSQIAGVALQAQPVSLEEAVAAATVIRVDISGALQGAFEIALSAPMTAQFAALLTGETLDPAVTEISGDTREAAAELIQQICGNAADRLRRTFGPLELKPHLAERDPESGERQLFLITRENDALDFEFHILGLVAEVKPEPEPVAEVAQSAAQPVSSASTEQSTNPVPSSDAGLTQFSNRNLDLLLDIELGVTLRFGVRQMLLKDVIELCSGSVVELDRRVEQPVDLLIDGRLIAQGEVVIVDGNYGLRITQVATPGDKIACLSSR